MSLASALGVSTLVAKPIRWRPPASSSTVDAECSKSIALRLDAVVRPQAPQPRLAAEHPAHPAGHLALQREAPRRARGVVGGIDADGDHRHVVAELVERRRGSGRPSAGRCPRRSCRGTSRRPAARAARRGARRGRPRRAARRSPGALHRAGASRPEKTPLRAARSPAANSSTPATAVIANRPVRNSARRTRADTRRRVVADGRPAGRAGLGGPTPRSGRGGSRSARARRDRACRACAAGWRGATRSSSRRGAGPRRSRGWCAPRRSA